MWTGDRKPPTWENDGNCLDKPVSMFFLSEIGDVDVLHIRPKDPERWVKLKRFNKRKMDRAVEICRGCPVWLECLESANWEDRKYAVRGGHPPEKFESEDFREGWEASLSNLKRGGNAEENWERGQWARKEKMSKPCQTCGEKDWGITNKGVRGKERIRCNVCKRRQQNDHYAKKRAAKLES